MEFEPKKQKIQETKEENDKSLFLNLFDTNIIQQIFTQLVNIDPFPGYIKECYSDCTSFSSTSKLLNSISKQTQFSIKIFQNQKIENINYNIYLKLYYILQQEDIKIKVFHSKEEILNNILIYVSKNGFYNLIQTLILNGANPNYEDDDYYDYTPLCHSCENGHYKTTKLLILNNANINDGTTVLHDACRSNNLKLVKYLVMQGLNVNFIDTLRETPLFYACYSGNLDIAKYLINNGAVVYIKNQEKQTVLFQACSSGNLDLVKYLVEETQVALHCQDKCGRTILFTAIFSENTELIDYLLSLGLTINQRDKSGDTPIYIACKDLQDLEITKRLISKGADLTLKYEENRNILEVANKDQEMIPILGFVQEDTNQDLIQELQKHF